MLVFPAPEAAPSGQPYKVRFNLKATGEKETRRGPVLEPMAFSGLVYQLPLVHGTPAEPPCHLCPAICCSYFALQIDTPTCKKDFENLRWYLMHEKIHVFVDNGEWYLQVWNRCMNLMPDNRCGIYETRPQICRDYGFGEEREVNCHATSESNKEYEILFTEASQLEEYYKKWYETRYGWRNKKRRKKSS